MELPMNVQLEGDEVLQEKLTRATKGMVAACDEAGLTTREALVALALGMRSLLSVLAAEDAAILGSGKTGQA